MGDRTDRPIVYITRMLPTYRMPVMRALNERLNGRLVVLAGAPPNRSSLSSLTTAESPGFRLEPVRNHWLGEEALHASWPLTTLRKLGKPGAVILEESPRSLTSPIVLAYARAKNIPLALWGHFLSRHRLFAPDNSFADRYRMALGRSVAACICYTEEIAALIERHVDPSKVFVARNTMDTARLLGYRESLESEGKAEVRRRVGLDADSATIAFLGRLIEEKGTERLLNVFRTISKERKAQLVIIGDGPDRPRLEKRVKDETIADVHFLGALVDWERSAPYLFASDVMLIPGYLGLAVNHAFSFGLPVVSVAAPDGLRFHSPEAVYVRNGVNGILASPASDAALVEAVRSVMEDQYTYSKAALGTARDDLGLDRMVDGLESAVKYLEDLQ